VILRFRAELCSALGEVEKCHDGIFQQAATPNHYFDATYRAIVARSMRGIGVLESPTLPTMPAVPLGLSSGRRQPTGPQQSSTPSVAIYERNRW
jgi:hypothetical protein